MIDERNAGREARLSEERTLLRPLPVRALPTYREAEMTVGRWGIIRVAKKPYSLPSRLIGHRVKVSLFADHLEVHYRGELVARPERVSGDGLEGIDYRHLVHSLVRKPGAFRRYVYREALFPTLTFRRAYDVLAERSERWADLEYVRILHLAATTMECEVEAALAASLDAGAVPEYELVKSRVKPAAPLSAPPVRVRLPDLTAYDALLLGNREASV